MTMHEYKLVASKNLSIQGQQIRVGDTVAEVKLHSAFDMARGGRAIVAGIICDQSELSENAVKEIARLKQADADLAESNQADTSIEDKAEPG